MDGREQALAIARGMNTGTLGLAEGVRRIFALRASLPEDHPLHALLAPLAGLDARYDLALAGYESMEALTAEMRAEAEHLLLGLGSARL